MTDTHPEATQFQIIYSTYSDQQQMTRHRLPFTDIQACSTEAQAIAKRYDVKEVFICTVHAAFTKETTIKQVI